MSRMLSQRERRILRLTDFVNRLREIRDDFHAFDLIDVHRKDRILGLIADADDELVIAINDLAWEGQEWSRPSEEVENVGCSIGKTGVDVGRTAGKPAEGSSGKPIS